MEQGRCDKSPEKKDAGDLGMMRPRARGSAWLRGRGSAGRHDVRHAMVAGKR